MEKDTIIIALVGFTLIVGLIIGFYQLWSVEDSKKKGSQSSFAKRDNVKPATKQ